MDRRDEFETEEEIFLRGLRQSIDRMDHVLDHPSTPSKEQLKGHIHERIQRRRKSMIMELLLFWLVSLFVIGGGVLLVYSASWIVWLIQGISFVTAFVIVVHFNIDGRKEGLR
ncbi:YxlC family protein [Paenibacillus antarcticus]|uniref:Uncharacterized protein n=1 Tax=Paenibacillus antarcticus TaxID=253703 RepID=A0A168NJD4_9BACL|nr:YxlC family protein [Paenibacillus antarcticus]OAB45850.1 hypothetical protein PBAT_13190 [Paenibacillus antarcticus]